MGENEAKIIEYAKRQLAQRQHEKLSKKDARYLKRLDQGLCWKCEKPLEVIACYHAFTTKEQPSKYSPEEILTKCNLKGESFALSCEHVMTIEPDDPNFQIKTSRAMIEFGDDYSIRQFEKDKRTKEERELALARKFTEKEYPEYEDLEKDEEDSPIAHKIDRSDQILLQITRWDPDQKLWKGMYGEGYVRHKYDSEGTEHDLIRCIDKKQYDPAVYNELILLIDTWPLVPEKVKEGLSGKTSQLLEDRKYREVWLIHEETGETVRIWPE
jgi:hypothetical protein